MRNLEIDDIKRISLDGLKYFHRFCEENNLTYYLGYGSLLGAIRHKGFIPWDDDIDLLMPRKDYDKLLALKTKVDNDEWELFSSITNDGYFFDFAKLANKKTEYFPSRFKSGLLYGVPIDIFPMDLVIDKNDRDALKNGFNRMKMSNCFLFAGQKPTIKDFIKSSIKCVLFGSFKKVSRKFEDQVVYIEDGNYYASIFAPTCDMWKKEDFDNKELKQFEDCEFWVPGNWDSILKETYKEYMRLPPESERVYKHEILACFKE